MTSRTRRSNRCCSTGPATAVAVPHGSLGFRYGDDGVGKWNLDLGDVSPALTVLRAHDDAEDCAHCAAALRQHRRARRNAGAGCAGAPCRRAPGLHGVRPDARPVRGGPTRVAGGLAYRLRRSRSSVHPGLAGGDHRGFCGANHPYRKGIRPQRRGVRRPVHDHHGRGHLPVVPRRRHLPGGAGPAAAHRVDGTQRWRLGALRRSGEVPSGHRVGHVGDGHRLVASAAPDGRHLLLVCPHRPVALRRLPGRRPGQPAGPRPVRG